MRVEVRRALPGDGEALVRIHADASAYYAELDPALFQNPELDGFAELLEKDFAEEDASALDLVAEVDGEPIAVLFARLKTPPEGAGYAYPRDVMATRLEIEYLATASAHRRTGARPRARRGRRGVGPRTGCDRRRGQHLSPQPALDPVLDRARGLRAALAQPPQGALKRRGNARVVTSLSVHPQGERDMKALVFGGPGSGPGTAPRIPGSRSRRT